MFIPHNEKTINLAYKSKYNRKRENQVVLLMITNGKQSDEVDKWHYTALKSVRTDDGFNRPIRSLSRLFRGITSNNHGDFYCLGCLHSFRTDNALKKHERLCGNNDYCHVEMPTEDNNKLKYNHGEKSLKAPFAIYADLECLLIKQQSCIRELAEEFKGQFECFRENKEKYIILSVPIKKEHDNDKTITYRINFSDSYRFMQSKLSDLVDNLSEINNKDSKTCTERKNIKSECKFIGF